MADQVLFNRRARVIVGNRQTGIARQFDELMVELEIEKSSEPTPNRAKISVFNVNEENRQIISKQSEDHVLFCTLFTGYGDDSNLELLFAGDITRAYPERKDRDIIMHMEQGDGQRAFEDSFVNKSFGPGVSFDAIIGEVAKSFGLPVRMAGLKTETFNQGVTISGQSSYLLSTFLSKQGMEWSIQNGELVIKPVGEADGIEVIELSPETGLIGSPKKTDKGLEFDSLLNAKLVPGRPVRLVSPISGIDGIFVCRKVKHKGNSQRGDWRSSVEAI